MAAGSTVVLAFGLWLMHLERVGYDTAWVDAALALFVAVGVLGGIGGQRPKRARELAQRGGDGAELRTLLDDRLARALNYLSAVLLIAIVALMVFKP